MTRRPVAIVAWTLVALFLIVPAALGNWFAGFGPALVVVAAIYVARWKRDARRER